MSEKLEQQITKLACDLLELASDEFLNHGCNDFPMPQDSEILADFKQWVIEQTGDEDYKVGTIESDHWLMEYVAERLCSKQNQIETA